MKNRSYVSITLLVIGWIFIILGFINIGISLFWDFSNAENLIIGIMMLIFGIIGILVNHYLHRWRNK